MPGSITSVPSTNASIVKYVVAVGCLVTSLMLTAFGYSSNAWIVFNRPHHYDEFQRGVRGHDCYLAKGEKIKCVPWDFLNKTKFPAPFDNVLEPSGVIYLATYLAVIIFSSQIFWLVYTIGHCCWEKFSIKMDKFKLVFFHAMVFPVGFWVILSILILIESFSDSVFPAPLIPNEDTYHIGFGFWLFFLGGLPPYMIAVYALFGDQIERSQSCIGRTLRGERQPVPTDAPGEEMVRRN